MKSGRRASYIRFNSAVASQNGNIPAPPAGSRVVIQSIKAVRGNGGAATVLRVTVRRLSDNRVEHIIQREHAAGVAFDIEDGGPYVSEQGDSFNILVDSIDAGAVSAHVTYTIQAGG